MSHNEHECGTITLPSAEVAKVRAVLGAVANDLHERVYQLARQRHATITTKSPRLYAEAVQKLQLADDGRRTWMTTQATAISAAAYNVLNSIAAKPHVPTHGDVDRIAPRATNRTSAWECLGKYGYAVGDVSLKGRELTWDAEGNRAVEESHESALAVALFAHLAKVKWSATSGGTLWYNSEYNEGPSGQSWGGGDTASEVYGPAATEARDRARGYTDSGKLLAAR